MFPRQTFTEGCGRYAKRNNKLLNPPDPLTEVR
jgi:hypothetical protein